MTSDESKYEIDCEVEFAEPNFNIAMSRYIPQNKDVEEKLECYGSLIRRISQKDYDQIVKNLEKEKKH